MMVLGCRQANMQFEGTNEVQGQLHRERINSFPQTSHKCRGCTKEHSDLRSNRVFVVDTTNPVPSTLHRVISTLSQEQLLSSTRCDPGPLSTAGTEEHLVGWESHQNGTHPLSTPQKIHKQNQKPFGRRALAWV